MPVRFAQFTNSAFAAALAALAVSGCARNPYFQPDARPEAVRAQALPASADTVRNATAGRQYNAHGRLYEALVGQHQRRSWAAPVTVPVMRLATAYPGGLRPGKVGGGFNSTSLSLLAANSRAYVLRTVDKDPVRATPRLLRGTFLVNALRDNVSATQPYAALVVPLLSAALAVPYCSPRLFYVRADDPAFKSDSLRHFRGQLALLEEKFSGPTAPVPGLGRVPVLGSKEAFAAVFANPSLRFGQTALLRARLLDAFMGDWDRHPGQWNWAEVVGENPADKTLVPLPKDRDMVFYRLDDGALGWLAGHVLLRHWTTFRATYAPATNLFSSGRYLDARGLNGLSRAQFQAVAKAMQQRLSDTLLARAVLRLPPAVWALEGPRSTAALRARRDALPALADAFYLRLARRVTVGGTDAPERFVVQRFADSTRVTVYAGSSGIAPMMYRRTFYPAETRTIQLEGLGGNDVFEVSGAPGISRPAVRGFGGNGADTMPAPAGGSGVRIGQGSAPAKHAYDAPPKE